MARRFAGWIMAASVAAGVGLAQPGEAEAATTTFLDPGAWMGAAWNLSGFRVQSMPAVSPDRITMSDGFGSWTLAGQPTATVILPHPDLGTPMPPRPRALTPHQVLFGQSIKTDSWATSELGSLSGNFGCNTVFYPCYGMNIVEFVFETPILGFAGNLAYGESHYTSDGFVSYLRGIAASPTFYNAGDAGFRFTGFYGTIFSEPTSTLRFSWYDDNSPGGRPNDGSALFWLSDALVIGVPVPEPQLSASFALAILLLVAATRRASVARTR
jgi:hypothetical protein